MDIEVVDETVLELPPESNDSIYNSYKKWQETRNSGDTPEDTMLAYLKEIATMHQPTTLQNRYDSLRKSLMENENINIEYYEKLKNFIKDKLAEYQLIDSKSFSKDEITQFLERADDKAYLQSKAILIVGVCGNLAAEYMKSILLEDVSIKNDIIEINVRFMLMEKSDERLFQISGEYFQVFNNYVTLRRNYSDNGPLFLKYVDGEFTDECVSYMIFMTTPKSIAIFLNLSDTDEYTSDAYRNTYRMLFNDGKSTTNENNDTGLRKSSRHRKSYRVYLDSEEEIDDDYENEKQKEEETEDEIETANAEMSSDPNIVITGVSGSKTKLVEFPASKEERLYFDETFTNFDVVPNLKSHCTSCGKHIGCAISAPMKTHPVLNVSMCLTCFQFYTSGEFDKGEDGSELYCRWCGEGGQVICCSKCCFVFCSRCIKSNLSKDYLDKVKEIDNWICFACDPKLILRQRAEHLALTQFINNRQTQLYVAGLNSTEESLKIHEDLSKCCKSKNLKRKETKRIGKVTNDSNILPKKQKKEKDKNDTTLESNNDADDLSLYILKASQFVNELKNSAENVVSNNDLTCKPDLSYMIHSTQNTKDLNTELSQRSQRSIEKASGRHIKIMQSIPSVELATINVSSDSTKKTFKSSAVMKGMDALQKQILVGSDTSHYLVDKLTFMLNSPIYKSAATLADLKDLLIRLVYLYSYSILRLEESIGIYSRTLKEIHKDADMMEGDNISQTNNNSNDGSINLLGTELTNKESASIDGNTEPMETSEMNVFNEEPLHEDAGLNSGTDSTRIIIIEDQQLEPITDVHLIKIDGNCDA